MARIVPLALCALGVACAPVGSDGPNFLVVVWDDVGTDKVGVYGENPEPPATPNLDALAAEGMLFRRAYANPLCSPTRAGLVTGRYAFRYDIGSYLTTNSGWELPPSEVTVAEALWRGGRYDSAAAGKWHLGGPEDSPGHPPHAEKFGFRTYVGAPDNLMGGTLADGLDEDYFHYERIDDGDWSIVDGYATLDLTDDAISLLGQLEEPWLLWVGYHAAHMPWHAPPDPLNPNGVEARDPAPLRFDAMVQSLDIELGRLLAAMTPEAREHTTIIVIGDNGTPKDVKTGPQAGLPGKGKVYEGGTRVPLVVAGASVVDAGTESDALVSHTDLFATLTDLAGVDADVPEESISFAPNLVDATLPARDFAYAEVFLPRGPGPHTERYDRMLRGDRYKLVRRLDEPDELYDLLDDPTEQVDLLSEPLSSDAETALRALDREMALLEAESD